MLSEAVQNYIDLCKKARKEFRVGDHVRRLINDSPHWGHPSLSHKVFVGGVITNISEYCTEIDVKWFQTGLSDRLSPLDIIKM